mgnify:CR=1 FL=1
MAIKLKHLIDVHEDELSLFLWSMLLMLLRSSGIILNNFAETTFLKRYGVEYLPVVYMLNSVITFVVMARLSALMARLEGNQILSYVLVFCAASMVALRFVMNLDISLIYPLLFVLKAQFDILLGLLFWNLANDLFNVRQSKRLFPLIVAGGVAGEIIGSFGTPVIGQLTAINNLMLVYAFNIMLAFITITRMRFRFPTLLLTKERTKAPKFKPALPEQFRNIRLVMRETPLVTVLIFLTLLPNIIIPVLNYQFNYAVNSQFATETGMIQFFGVFRGVMNIVSLCLLLFVGKVYNRIGLPVALMFHPCNYFLVFTAFLFRFDVFSAMYARLSTNVIRTTLNKPVTDVLMGIFPTSYRNKIRPFLRGTVVRIGLFTGSGLVLISDGICHPKFLSLAIFPVVVIWILTTVYLKRNYSGILSSLLSKDMLDLKALEDRDVNHLFRESAPKDDLVRTFLAARGEEAVWHARLLKSVDLPGLDTHILTTLPHQDPGTQIVLLDMVSGQAESLDTEKLAPMADIRNPELFAAALRALKRAGADTASIVTPEMTASRMPPEVRAYAAAGLYVRQPDHYRATVGAWMASEDTGDRKAGVIAAGESGDPAHIVRLERLLEKGAAPGLIPLILTALSALEYQDTSRYTTVYLTHPDEAVRLAALEGTDITDDTAMTRVIPLLGDRSEMVREMAEEKLKTAPHCNGQLLIASLDLPQKTIREGVFRLLKTLEIKEQDTYLFARNRIETCYGHLAVSRTLSRLPDTPGNALLAEHLAQRIQDNIEGLIRVLSIRDNSGKFRIVFRTLFSRDTRRRANAQELLDRIMAPALLKKLMPLIDGTDPAKALAKAQKKFNLPDFRHDPKSVYLYLLEGDCPVSSLLAGHCIIEAGLLERFRANISQFTQSSHPGLAQFARHTAAGPGNEDDMNADLPIPEKILRLKKIRIFKKLSINELAAIAAISRKKTYSPGEVVFTEGEIADTMVLIMDGELSMQKSAKKAGGKMFQPGESIGEAALLLDEVRLITLVAETHTTLLEINKQEFTEIVREYPEIGLEIAVAMAGKVQELLEQAVEGTYPLVQADRQDTENR